MVYILLGTGYEEIEALAACDVLRRGGVKTALVGIDGASVTGANGITVKADCGLAGVSLKEMEMLVVPGGGGGVESIKKSRGAMELIADAYKAGKELASICAGPTVLAKLGITDGKKVTCYPGTEGMMGSAVICQQESTVRDGRLTTGRGPGSGIDFGLRLLEVLRGKQAADAVAGGMYYAR